MERGGVAPRASAPRPPSALLPGPPGRERGPSWQSQCSRPLLPQHWAIHWAIRGWCRLAPTRSMAPSLTRFSTWPPSRLLLRTCCRRKKNLKPDQNCSPLPFPSRLYKPPLALNLNTSPRQRDVIFTYSGMRRARLVRGHFGPPKKGHLGPPTRTPRTLARTARTCAELWPGQPGLWPGQPRLCPGQPAFFGQDSHNMKDPNMSSCISHLHPPTPLKRKNPSVIYIPPPPLKRKKSEP